MADRERVLKEWKDKCDAVYLYANDSVLGFYPKYGFIRAKEYQYTRPIRKKNFGAAKLDMTAARDRDLLLYKYTLSNPFSALPMVNNTGLLMFYCSQSMKDHVYYLSQYDVVVIADYNGENLICYDVFGGAENQLDNILCAMALQNTNSTVFGFTPKEKNDCKAVELNEEDTTLFILNRSENLFAHDQIMLPLLSRA